jgi:hypothetical protein
LTKEEASGLRKKEKGIFWANVKREKRKRAG